MGGMFALLSDEHGMSRTTANRDSGDAVKSLKQDNYRDRKNFVVSTVDAAILAAASIRRAKIR
jgi:hypothetical protein